MKSRQWFELINSPEGIDLTVTMEGTGSATAKIYPDGKIVVELTDAQVDKYVNLSTPYGMKVLNAHSIHQDATSAAWQLKNTAAAITDAVTMAASDKDIDVATEIDDAAYQFVEDDDDLRIAVTTAAANATLVIQVQFT